MRREGLYSSHLAQWRAQRRQGETAALRDNKRGRPAQDAVMLELEHLRKDNQQLLKRLHQAEAIIDVQKKISMLLDRPLNPGTD